MGVGVLKVGSLIQFFGGLNGGLLLLDGVLIGTSVSNSAFAAYPSPTNGTLLSKKKLGFRFPHLIH